MWTSAETVVTTTSMTAVSVSMRSAQLAESSPEFTQRRSSTLSRCGCAEEADEDDPAQDAGDDQQSRGQIHGPGRAIVVTVALVMAVVAMRHGL